jgi:hypothetical protein
MPPDKKKQQAETRKQIWIITYEHTCTTITPAMLQQHKIHPRECHTAVWRGSKYTLVHCDREKRVSKAVIDAMIDKLLKIHSIVLECPVSGHNLLSSTDSSKNEELTSHPGFVGIMELFVAQSADLELWVGEGKTTIGDVAALKESLIYKHLKIEKKRSLGPEQKIADLTSQLADKALQATELLSQLNEKDQANAALSSQLAAKDQEIAGLSLQLAAKDHMIAEITSADAQQSNPAQLQYELKQSQQEHQKILDKYNGMCAEIINEVTTHAAYRTFRSKVVAENL